MELAAARRLCITIAAAIIVPKTASSQAEASGTADTEIFRPRASDAVKLYLALKSREPTAPAPEAR